MAGHEHKRRGKHSKSKSRHGFLDTLAAALRPIVTSNDKSSRERQKEKHRDEFHKTHRHPEDLPMFKYLPKHEQRAILKQSDEYYGRGQSEPRHRSSSSHHESRSSRHHDSKSKHASSSSQHESRSSGHHDSKSKHTSSSSRHESRSSGHHGSKSGHGSRSSQHHSSSSSRHKPGSKHGRSGSGSSRHKSESSRRGSSNGTLSIKDLLLGSRTKKSSSRATSDKSKTRGSSKEEDGDRALQAWAENTRPGTPSGSSDSYTSPPPRHRSSNASSSRHHSSRHGGNTQGGRHSIPLERIPENAAVSASTEYTIPRPDIDPHRQGNDQFGQGVYWQRTSYEYTRHFPEPTYSPSRGHAGHVQHAMGNTGARDYYDDPSLLDCWHEGVKGLGDDNVSQADAFYAYYGSEVGGRHGGYNDDPRDWTSAVSSSTDSFVSTSSEERDHNDAETLRPDDSVSGILQNMRIREKEALDELRKKARRSSFR